MSQKNPSIEMFERLFSGYCKTHCPRMQEARKKYMYHDAYEIFESEQFNLAIAETIFEFVLGRYMIDEKLNAIDFMLDLYTDDSDFYDQDENVEKYMDQVLETFRKSKKYESFLPALFAIGPINPFLIRLIESAKSYAESLIEQQKNLSQYREILLNLADFQRHISQK